LGDICSTLRYRYCIIFFQEKNDIIKVASETDNSRCNYIECDPNMPPIGTRVRRGPDWRWQEQDLDMAGTVVSHTKNGKVYLGFLEENSKS
jgi:hypothetical protein